MSFLFVTGMFRSGTTLLAKMLDAHPEISFASDPYRPLFNDFRDLIKEGSKGLKEEPPQAPLSDYFCDDEGLALMKAIQESDLNRKISDERLQSLIPVMAQRTLEFSPLISERMHALRGDTYKEVYESMMALIQECYGKKDASLIGSKEVWCTEFVSVLLRTFPDMKVILMVRDPRAVSASRKKLVEGENYPWIFLARQWRKLATFTWLFSHSAEFRSSVMVVRYEDLVSDPVSMSRQICSFLGIPFASEMIDGTKFREGDGRSPWSANSSYGTCQGISTSFSQKWKEALEDEEIKFIELLCFPEMKLFAYEPMHPEVKTFPTGAVWNPLIIPPAQLAEWIKRYSNCNLIFNTVEMMKEHFRRQLLTLPDAELSGIDSRIIEALYIHPRFFNHIREWMQNGMKEEFQEISKNAR